MSDLTSVRSVELNDGKRLFLAVVFTIIGAALIFIVSRLLLIHSDFLGSIYENGVPRALAGFFLFAFPYIHQRLAGKRRASFWHLPDGAVPFEGYTLPWYILLAYGVLIAFAIAGLSLFLVWLLGLVTGFFITRLISILSLILLLITFYYLGFWTGSRSARNPFLIAAGIVLGYILLELLVASVTTFDSPLRSVFGLLIFLVLSLVAVLTGAHTGRRRHLSNYVHFLLSPLPERERQAAIEDLYRGVERRASGVQQLPDERGKSNRLGR